MASFSATPSAVKTTTTESYVSSVDFLSAIHKPDVGEVLVKRYGDQGLTGFLESQGNKKTVANKEYIHYEEDWIHQTFPLAATANLGPSSNGTITGGYVFEATLADDASTTQDEKDYHFLRVNNIIEFENGQVALVVCLSIGTTVYTAENYTAQAIGATVTAAADKVYVECLTYDGTNAGIAAIVSKVCILTGFEYGEGTDQPDGITPNVVKYVNTPMIIKEAYEVTGSEATNATWFRVENAATGQSGWLWYLKGESDTYSRFNDYAEMQMIVGEQVASAATGLTALGVRGTEGLLDFAEGGNYIGYGAAAGVADFRTVVVALDKNRGAKENSMWCGLTASLDLDDDFRDYFGGSSNNGGASFGMFDGGSEMAVQMGFNSFAYGGYSFHKTTYKAFNYTKMLGYATAAGADSKYRTYILVVPGDEQTDPVSRELVPSLAVRYKEAGGYSREMEHWLTGGAVLRNKTNGEDKLKCNYRTERGFEGFAPNRWALAYKSA
jgi:hypothetical protein